jgi:hypothetical protein
MAMKILFCCDVLGEENNGTTIATMNVARSLRKKGHEVRILCPDEMYRGQEGFYICPRIHFGPFDNYVKSNGVTLASKKDKKIIEEAGMELTDEEMNQVAGGYSKFIENLIESQFH